VKVNTEYPFRDLGVSNALGTGNFPRHRWYFVKEGFSPELVDLAIGVEGVAPGEVLADPFSGGGTVALAGALAGLSTQAFEVNPFLRFLSSTKLRNASDAEFRKSCLSVSLALEKLVPSPLEGYSTFTSGNRWNRWLFPTPALRTFEAGRRAVAQLPPAHAGLLKLALIGAAMDCCNATRDGKCLRYPSGWIQKEATPARFRASFSGRVAVIAEDLANVPVPRGLSSVSEGDARRLIPLMKEKFRLCVTSPPYLNSFDYSDVYRPELFLGGFVGSTDSLMRVRLRTIRSHLQAAWQVPKKDQFGALYANCVAEIRERSRNLWSPRIPSMVQAYFEDMERILRSLRARARKNASLWLVVSTSAYAGVEVPVDLILADVGQRTGWYLREIGVLRYLRSSPQHVQHVDEKVSKSVPLRESVVILDALPH
jgi:hypothetical protein